VVVQHNGIRISSVPLFVIVLICLADFFDVVCPSSKSEREVMNRRTVWLMSTLLL